MLAAEVAWWETTLGMGIQPQKNKLSWELSALVYGGSLRRGRGCPECCHPPGKHAAGIAPHQHARLAAVLAWVSKGIHIHESAGEDARPIWALSKEQKAPRWSPGTFFPSAPLPTTAAPDSGCSQCPGKCWPSASSQPHCHFVQAGTGDRLGKRCGQSLGGSCVPGDCSRALGGTFGRTPPGTGASSHFSAWICQACAASSALTTHRGQVHWGWEGFHSGSTMYTS